MANVYDNIINGSFNALNPSVAEMYAGIYPPASSTSTPSYQSGMLGRGQPTRLPTLSNPMMGYEQLQPGTPLIPPAGFRQMVPTAYDAPGVSAADWYSTPGNYVSKTGTKGVTNAYPGAPPVGIPNAPGATWGQFEQANYDARNKPGTWMAQSRMQAQALMRQMAIQRASGGYRGGGAVPGGVPIGAPVTAATAAVKPQGWQGLLSMIFGSPKTGAPASAIPTAAPVSAPYGGRYTPQELAARTAQGIAIGDANRASPTPTHDVAGNNNAFMSTDHQNSVRWQTGY